MSVDWAQVFHTTYADLVRFLHRKVWDPDRASDLAQEAFARALHQNPDNPRAWLFTVATNLARDEARTAIRRKRHLELIKVETPASAPDAATLAEESERSSRVKRALDQLTERDREALLLWDAGLSYPEIAAQTGLAVSAVGTTLSRARKKLVEAFEALEGKHAARG
ncbi:MAG TPA: sigma-70 family RNA polymerase sigma factor [Gemmatimonadales bacterium]